MRGTAAQSMSKVCVVSGTYAKAGCELAREGIAELVGEGVLIGTTTVRVRKTAGGRERTPKGHAERFPKIPSGGRRARKEFRERGEPKDTRSTTYRATRRQTTCKS
jgi:hypothetical protein